MGSSPIAATMNFFEREDIEDRLSGWVPVLREKKYPLAMLRSLTNESWCSIGMQDGPRWISLYQVRLQKPEQFAIFQQKLSDFCKAKDIIYVIPEELCYV